jgi:hypothetical protein
LPSAQTAVQAGATTRTRCPTSGGVQTSEASATSTTAATTRSAPTSTGATATSAVASNACRKAYCKKFLGATVCEPVTYGSCTAIADTYCAAVRSMAAGIYAKAQDLQKRYDTCIAENGGITPPPPPVLCSNGRPEGATWTERDGCTTTTYVCRNGKITVTGSFRPPHCIES